MQNFKNCYLGYFHRYYTLKMEFSKHWKIEIIHQNLNQSSCNPKNDSFWWFRHYKIDFTQNLSHSKIEFPLWLNDYNRKNKSFFTIFRSDWWLARETLRTPSWNPFSSQPRLRSLQKSIFRATWRVGHLEIRIEFEAPLPYSTDHKRPPNSQ